MRGKEKIYKFELQPGRTELLLPPEAQILKIAAINEKMFAWVLGEFDSYYDENKEKVAFQVFATGQEMPRHMEPLVFIDTVLMPTSEGSTLVWHVFKDRS